MYGIGGGEVDVSSDSWLDGMPLFISFTVVLAKNIMPFQAEETCLLSTGLLQSLHPTLQTFLRLQVIALWQSEEQLETATTGQQSPMHQANLPLQTESVK